MAPVLAASLVCIMLALSSTMKFSAPALFTIPSDIVKVVPEVTVIDAPLLTVRLSTSNSPSVPVL
ncbi:hypothetical protein [Flavobacterium suaedae]|uniref:hypothetical protein n=1 Tax=Flavobacterium suaedae TaxID=1767027 RepID=UPI00166765A0|nr:hypothetical protein [Flavobacterium suaedae]